LLLPSAPALSSIKKKKRKSIKSPGFEDNQVAHTFFEGISSVGIGMQASVATAVYAAIVAGAFFKLNLPLELQLPLAALLFIGWQWLSSPRTAPSFKGVSDEKNRRQNITKLRATSKLFPGPYPNGWYYICRSTDLKRGDTMAVTAFGRELAAFRGENGIAGVLNAFCPHLGTHLGHGGKVEGNNLVCPYHRFVLTTLMNATISFSACTLFSAGRSTRMGRANRSPTVTERSARSGIE
jgi:hypothetical protein